MQRRGGLGGQLVQPGGGAGPRPGAEVQHVAGTSGASAAAQRVGGTRRAGGPGKTGLLENREAEGIWCLFSQMVELINVGFESTFICLLCSIDHSCSIILQCP